jgi:hypothetical protein
MKPTEAPTIRQLGSLLVSLAGLGILTMPNSTHAFFDTLAITPATPVAESAYQFSVRAGGCHLIIGGPQQPLEYVVNGNTIRMTLDVIDNAPNDLFCVFPIHTQAFTLPGLPAGTYRFELWRRRSTQPIIPLTFVDAIDFTVVSGAPAPFSVPAGGPVGWLALAFSVLVAGVFTSRFRRYRGRRFDRETQERA